MPGVELRVETSSPLCEHRPVLRPFPNVNADGSVDIAIDPAEAAGGALMSLRPGGNDVAYHYHADEVLAACTPLPARLLLGFAVQTKRDRLNGAIAQALLYLLLATFPALLVGAFRRNITDSRSFALGALVVMVVAAMAWAFTREMLAPGKVWERTQWIDFERRVWCARKSHPDGSLQTEYAIVPLDELVLVCFVAYWEQGQSFDVGLCKRTEIKGRDFNDPHYLNRVHTSDTQPEAHAFACALAARWGLECWQLTGGMTPQKRRLA